MHVLHDVCQTGDVFAFTVEKLPEISTENNMNTQNKRESNNSDDDSKVNNKYLNAIGWKLQSTGRFAHSVSYIKSLTMKETNSRQSQMWEIIHLEDIIPR